MAGVRVGDELGGVAWLHLVQLVLPDQRNHLVAVFDEGHRQRDRERGSARARPQLHVDGISIGRRHHGGLLELPARVLQLCPHLDDRLVLVAHLATQALAHLSFAGDCLRSTATRLGEHAACGVGLCFQRLGVGLGRFHCEAITGAYSHELSKLFNTFARELQWHL